MLKEVFKETKTKLKGNMLMSFGILIMYMIIGISLMLVTLDDGSGIFFGLLYLLLFPLAYGMIYYFYNMTKGTQKLEDLIEFYIDYKTGLKLILAIVWYMLIVGIGLLLLVVPGIIWSYRYTMFMFFLFDNSDMSIEESFKKSAEMMKGYKFKFFLVPLYYMFVPMILYFVGIGMITAFAFGSFVNDVSTSSLYNMSDENYYEYENGDGTVTISFNPAKEGTYQISEDADKIMITVDNEANKTTNEIGYTVEDYDGHKYISIVAEEDGYDLVEEDGKITITAHKNSTNTELDAETENEESETNYNMLGIGTVVFIIGIVWLIYVMPATVLAQVVFYTKLRDKE